MATSWPRHTHAGTVQVYAHGVRALAVAREVRAAVAAHGGLVRAQRLVLVALPHRAPHARVVRPQLRAALWASVLLFSAFISESRPGQ